MAAGAVVTITTETRRRLLLRRGAVVAMAAGCASVAGLLAPVILGGAPGPRQASAVVNYTRDTHNLDLDCAGFAALDPKARHEVAVFFEVTVEFANGRRAPGDLTPPAPARTATMSAEITSSCTRATASMDAHARKTIRSPLIIRALRDFY